MNVSTAIKSRRAVKAFDPSYLISDDKIKQLMSLALLSPTSFNIQNWRFLLVQNLELRRKIREVAWDQAQVTDASLLIVLTADLKSWAKEPDRYWRNAPQPVKDFILPSIEKFYNGHEQVQRDEAMRSCGIVAMTLMLAAQEMGYASCPMVGFDFDKVGKLINLPADHVVAMFVAIGKGVKDAWARDGRLAIDEVVITDRF